MLPNMHGRKYTFYFTSQNTYIIFFFFCFFFVCCFSRYFFLLQFHYFGFCFLFHLNCTCGTIKRVSMLLNLDFSGAHLKRMTRVHCRNSLMRESGLFRWHSMVSKNENSELVSQKTRINRTDEASRIQCDLVEMWKCYSNCVAHCDRVNETDSKWPHQHRWFSPETNK